jgi:hypothetical protein
LLVGTALSAGAVEAAASTTLTTGYLTDEWGTPADGTVRVYATFPDGGASPLLGTAQAGPTGGFVVKADDPRQLVALAKARGGWLDWLAVAETGGHEGMWGSTSFIDSRGATVRSIRPDDVGPAGTAARVSAAAPAPRIAVKATRALPARISQGGRCKNEHVERVTNKAPRLAVVGELNNAYNDGTRATFVYGRGGESATYFGLAMDLNDGAGFRISGETFASYKGTTRFPTVRRRFARQMKTGFEMSRIVARNNSCAVWDVYIRPTDWLANQDTRTKLRGTLGRCLPEAFGRRGWSPGAGFETTNATAVRWSRGVTAYGAEVTTRSGFDENVGIRYRFGGRRGKQHYICGPDGKQSPASAGRIFSGARR